MTHLFMNVNQALDDLSEQPPDTVHVLIKAGIYTVPEGALLTVLHLLQRNERMERNLRKNDE